MRRCVEAAFGGGEDAADEARAQLPSYHFFRMLLDPEYSQPSSKPKFSDEVRLACLSFVRLLTSISQGNADIYSSDSAEDSEREHVRKGKLGKLAQRRFECMLRSLTSTREKIARGMAFALEHADAAPVVRPSSLSFNMR